MTTVPGIGTAGDTTARVLETHLLRTGAVISTDVDLPTDRFLVPSNDVPLNGKPITLSPSEVSRLAGLASRGIVEARTAQLTEERNRITIDDYWETFFRNPRLQMRSISHYIADAIDWSDKKFGYKTAKKFGKDLRDFSFLKLPWRPPELSKKDALFGQLLPWNRFYDKVSTFERYAFPNSFVLFHGPTSTGKSIGFDALFELLSEYSHTEEGALYSTEFIFPSKATFEGFESYSKRQEPPKRVLTPQKDIAAQIPANQRTNPFFLHPREKRLELIEQVKKLHLLPDGFNTNFAALYNMDDLSNRILSALITLYNDPENPNPSINDNVLNHITATRWYMSTTSGDGICVLQPSSAPGTYLKPIIPEIQWDNLDPKFVNLLQAARLDSLEGILGSSQIIYYDDMFADVDRQHELNEYMYLLRQAEKGDSTVTTPGGTLTKRVQTNVIVCGTANDSVIKKAEEIAPINAGNLFTRGECVSVGYQPLFKDLEDYLNKKLSTIISSEEFKRVSPNVTYATSLFLAMTYVFPSLRESYYNGLKMDANDKASLKSLAFQLNPLEKVLLYEQQPLDAYESDPHKFKFNSDQLKLLYGNTSAIHDEYDFGSSDDRLHLYEGIIGVPPRYAEKVLSEAIIAKLDDSFSLVELFALLEEKSKRKFDYEVDQANLIDQLKKIGAIPAKEKDKDSTNPLLSSSKILELLKEHMMKRISFEVRKATGLMKSRKDLTTEFQKYIMHATSYNQRTKVAQEWRVSSNEELPSEALMRKIETEVFDIPETKKDDHRSSLLGKLGAWGLDHTGERPVDHLDEEKLFKRQIDAMEAGNMQAYDAAVNGFLEDLKDLVLSSPNFDITTIPSLPPDITIHDADTANKFADGFFTGINLPSANNDPNRKRVLLKGLKGLQAHGYQKLDVIRKDVVFAFELLKKIEATKKK